MTSPRRVQFLTTNDQPDRSYDNLPTTKLPSSSSPKKKKKKKWPLVKATSNATQLSVLLLVHCDDDDYDYYEYNA